MTLIAADANRFVQAKSWTNVPTFSTKEQTPPFFPPLAGAAPSPDTPKSILMFFGGQWPFGPVPNTGLGSDLVRP
jgi:hypothetical protein